MVKRNLIRNYFNLICNLLLVCTGLSSFQEIRAEIVTDPKTLPAIVCPDRGPGFFFSLKNLPQNANVSEISKKIPGGISTIIAPGNGLHLRLDVCHISETQFLLKRVLYVAHSFSPIIALSESDSTFHKNEGLSEAILSGDYSQFYLLIEDKTNLGSGIVARGINESFGSYLAVTDVQIYTPDRWQITNIRAMAGRLELKDSFAQGKCQGGQSEIIYRFQMDTADFEYEVCTFLGGGETTGYDIKKVTVKDSSKLIPVALRNSPIILEGNDLSNALKYKWNHHNACDSFVLKVAKTSATYAATSAPMAGCGTSVEGAPKRDFDEQSKLAKYQIHYGSKTEGIKLLKIAHYFRLFE